MESKTPDFHERYAVDPDFRQRVDKARRETQLHRATKKRQAALKLMSDKQPDPRARLY